MKNKKRKKTSSVTTGRSNQANLAHFSKEFHRKPMRASVPRRNAPDLPPDASGRRPERLHPLVKAVLLNIVKSMLQALGNCFWQLVKPHVCETIKIIICIIDNIIRHRRL
ncbi:hypothetical protein [Thermogemmatispora aurantia]|uniref:hypothetical protein n=1 Tax=Thermogemmatispora aurantia TaxID=2045279 RepID=UPI00124F2D14|nr:hypothetical protein [Thermogemmatispora aurantia]